eukprot:119549-Pyramimonas_sp.AAC.1
MLAVGESGESSGRKWGTGHRVQRRGRVSGVSSAPLPLLAQEDPSNESKKAISIRISVRILVHDWCPLRVYSLSPSAIGAISMGTLVYSLASDPNAPLKRARVFDSSLIPSRPPLDPL